MTAGTRGVVVMLVDNGVTGDSRVQKQARSMAECGWDVYLLGRTLKSKTRVRWNIGAAKVTLLPFGPGMTQRRHEARRAPLRAPLAYRPGRISEYRKVQVVANRSLLETSIARHSRPGGSSVGRLWASACLVANKVAGRWVRLRAAHTVKLRSTRRDLTGWTDRVSTWFWTAMYGRSAWRKLDPELNEFEAVFGPVVDRLQPDIIHANDFRMLGVGARAKVRAAHAGRQVKLVWDAHEFLPGLHPWNSNPRWISAQILHERQYAHHADEVVTVTEPLAELLAAEHGLSPTPTVVLNAPWVGTDAASEVPDIRTACGLDEGVPLLVYSGAAKPQRGLDTMIEAMVDLPQTHVAFVVSAPPNKHVRSAVRRASELGVADRLHVLPYVEVEDIVPFLSTATIGVIPAHKLPNHEISLGTKFFEYSHAGLPIVVSNLKAMADMVTATGQGEVFVAEDTPSYVSAVQRVIDGPDRYRRAYQDVDRMNDWTWASQAVVLDRVYSRESPS